MSSTAEVEAPPPEQQNGLPEAAAEPAASVEAQPADQQEDAEPWRRRLWIVRMPRPPEAPAIKVLEQEVDTYRTQMSLITEALNVKKVERDSAREATRAARDAFMQSREAFEERNKPMRELAQQRQDAAAVANKLKESFSDLLVKSEAELEEQLKALNHRIEHESITLNEEKKALATIKKLQQQRERVREYEASASLFAETRAKRTELQEAMKEYEGEIKALRQEMDVQRQILDKLREHERGIDAEVEEIITERRRCREVMEEAYQRMSALKKAQWEKNNTFYSNRSFSRDIRKMVAEGKLEEARDACAEQQDDAVALLRDQPAFRSEYFALWEQQRKVPISAAEEEELPPPSKGAKGGAKGGKAKAAPAPEPVDPAKKAEATIAALLEEAREEARRAKAAAAAAEAAERDAAAAASAAEASLAAAEREQAAAARTVVGLEEEGAGAPRQHARPPRPAAARHVAPAVEPVVVPDENFELPEVVRTLKEKTPSSQELKELERERQRQAREEAERRKAKKAAEKEKKKARLLAAAARAQEAAAAAQVAAAAAVAAVGAEDTASSDGGEGNAPGAAADVAAPAEDAGAAAVAASAEQGGGELRRRGAAAAAKPKGLAGKPAARPRPAHSKPVTVRRWMRENELLVYGAAIVLIMFMLLMLWWTASTVPQ